jgi:hypothetical protein
MIPKTSPSLSGAIQARLTQLRKRKAELDNIIESLEEYRRLYLTPLGSRVGRPRLVRSRPEPRGNEPFAGAA